MSVKLEHKLVYLGIISSYSVKNRFLDLKDVPPQFPDISQETELFIGFSVNFLKKYKFRKIENRGTSMRLYLSDNTSIDFEKSLRMAVYIDKKTVEHFKSGYYGPEDLLDGMVYDQNDSFIGKVVDVHILPTQFVLYVDSDTYIVPLPFTKENLIEFDLKNKKIKLELPENYLDIAELKG